jgi:hypothetical protein
MESQFDIAALEALLAENARLREVANYCVNVLGDLIARSVACNEEGKMYERLRAALESARKK